MSEAKKGKKPVWKRWWVWAVIILLVIIAASSGGGDKPVADPDGPERKTGVDEMESKPAETPAETDRKTEINNAIKNRIDEGKYLNAKLKKITINDDLGADEPGNYIALVYFDFDIKNTRKTGNEIMRMYSDDLVATLANQGIQDISEVAIFWEDDYNKRSLKYAYEYRNGGFVVMDIAGE